MSTFRKRLTDIEERRAFRDWQDGLRQFEGKTPDELNFLAVHGYFPESLEGDLPQRQEFTVRRIKTIITTQWEDEDRKE
jgi:hypothetical protein